MKLKRSVKHPSPYADNRGNADSIKKGIQESILLIKDMSRFI